MQSDIDARRSVEQQLWRCLEAVHAVVYFAPEAADVYRRIGLRGFWMGYFASRSAALGPADPLLVTALFHGFAPAMVERALPDAWERCSPAEVLAARAELARTALTPHSAGVDLEGLVAELAPLVPRLDLAGRALAAAHAGLPAAADPLTRLWQLSSVLREYRGDGHVACLIAAGVNGPQSQLWHAAGGLLPDEQREFRGWTEPEWTAARAQLAERGWLGADGRLTTAGRDARADLEHRTDEHALPAFTPLPDRELAGLHERLAPLADSVAKAGAVPYPNAMGVPRPAAV